MRASKRHHLRVGVLPGGGEWQLLQRAGKRSAIAFLPFRPVIKSADWRLVKLKPMARLERLRGTTRATVFVLPFLGFT